MSTDDVVPARAMFELVLPKSQLHVDERWLTKRSSKDVNIAQHELSDVTDITMTTVTDPFGVGMITLGALGAPAARLWIPSPTWSWVAATVLGCAALLGLLGVRSVRIKLTTRHGTVLYGIEDTPEDAQAFVVSVRARLGLELDADGSRAD